MRTDKPTSKFTALSFAVLLLGALLSVPPAALAVDPCPVLGSCPASDQAASMSSPASSQAELLATVEKLTRGGKGILAADESIATFGKRLATVGLENSEDARRSFRQTLFTSEGIDKFISGVILHEETLFQLGTDGEALVAKLASRGLVPGIKVDIGLVPVPASPAEQLTQGLDGLRQRCDKFYAQGARFAKWRAVYTIDPASGLPSEVAVRLANERLALYALICQQAGLVPIVEPEVLADGSHGIEVCAAVTQRVQADLFKRLHDHSVLLEGILLKPNMVTPGTSGPAASPEQVAAATLQVLQRTVPPAVPGIMFLSGGQSEEASTLHLALMNKAAGRKPWALSFSYGRALQASAIKTWAQGEAQHSAARAKFMERAEANCKAAQGITA